MFLMEGSGTLTALISLHIRSMWETTVMHKQVSGRTVNFGPNFPDQSLLRNTPPHFGKLQIWDDQSLLRNTPPPHFGKLQIWDDQSLLWNTPPPPFWKTSDLELPKFTPEYPPPILENFRFGMTKVYSGITPPHFRKLQIWNDQSLLWNTPPTHTHTPPPPPPIENCQRVQVRELVSEYRELLHVETLSNLDNY